MNKKILLHLGIILLLGLIPLLWFKGNTIILGHDSGLPLDPITHFIDRIYVWSQRFGIGSDQSHALLGAFFIHGLEALLSFVGFSPQLEQKIQFIFWFTMPGLSMYFFVWKIWPEKKYMALIASIIYMINYYLIQAWFIAERTKFSIYIALPIVMYFLISYLTKKVNFLPAIIFTGLTLGIFNGGGSFPLYGGMIIATLVIYIYINLINSSTETLKRTVFYSIGIIIIYTLLNSYWLITYYFYVISYYNRDFAIAGGAGGVLTWLEYLSKGSTFINLFKGQGIPEWYLNEFHPYAAFVIGNPLYKLIGFAFAFFAILPLVIVKSTKDRFYIYLALFIALAAILFSAGTNSPFGFIFEGLVKFLPGFSIFRSAYYKFNYAAWFSYAILIGFALDYLLIKISEKKLKIPLFQNSNLLLLLFICIYLIYHYPILNGLFFDFNNDPSGKITTRVTVPKYVYDFGKWANNQDPNKRYLVLPELNDNTFVAYNWGFWSLAPLNSLFAKNSFVQNNTLISLSERILMKQMYSSLLNKDFASFLDFADVFAIDSIVVQKDYDWKNKTWGTTNPEKYEKILKESNNFKLEKEFSEWKIYKILHKSNRITVSHSLNFLKGDLGNIVSFPYFNPNIPLYIGDKSLSDDPAFANSVAGIFVSANCIGCDLKKDARGFEVYNPKLLPGSLLYKFFVTRNEDKIKSLANDFHSKVNFYLATSDRRSIEIKWMVTFNRNLPELQHTLERQYNSIRSLNSELSRGDWGMDAAQSDEIARKVTDHLLNQTSLLSSVHDDKLLDLQNKRTLASSYDIIMNTIEMIKDKRWFTENANLKKYIFKLPLLDNYDIYVKKNSLANPNLNTDESTLFIRENGKTLKPINQVGNWIYYGNSNFTSKILRVAFTDSTVENIINKITPIFPSGKSGIAKTADSYTMTGDSVNKCLNFPITNLNVKENYIVSFNYRTFTDKKTLSFSIDSGTRKNASLRTKETLLPSIQNWTTFKTAFSPTNPTAAINFCNGFTTASELEGYAPWLEFGATEYGLMTPSGLAYNDLGVVVSEIKDISFSKLSEPTIVFYKKGQASKESDTLINYTKKNPVEYDVVLSKTSLPTYITMKESFGKYWRVCDVNGKCFPFESKMHFADAGFMNTWYFKNGVGPKLNFYYYPQKTFLIGTIISVITYLSLFAWILNRIRVKRKKNK